MIEDFNRDRVVSVGTIAREDQNRMQDNLTQIIESKIKETDLVGFLKKHPKALEEIKKDYTIGQILERNFFFPQRSLKALNNMGIKDAEKIVREYYQSLGFEDFQDPIGEFAFKLTPGARREYLMLLRGLGGRADGAFPTETFTEEDMEPGGRAQRAYQAQLASLGIEPQSTTQTLNNTSASTPQQRNLPPTPPAPPTTTTAPTLQTNRISAPSIQLPSIFNISTNPNTRIPTQPLNAQAFRLGLEVGAANYNIRANILSQLEREMTKMYKEAGKGLAYLPFSIAFPINKAGELTIENASELSETEHRFYMLNTIRSLTNTEKNTYKNKRILTMPLASANIPEMNNLYGQIRGLILQSVNDAAKDNQKPVRWALFKLDKGLMALIPLFYNKRTNQYLPITATLTSVNRDGTAKGTYATLGIFFHEAAISDVRNIVRNMVVTYNNDANPKTNSPQEKARLARMNIDELTRWLNENSVIPIIQPFGG